MERSEVIAEREILFVAPDGSEVKAPLQFGRPYPNDEHGCFYCDFEVPGIVKRRYTAGVDGLQAMLLSMVTAAAHLDVKIGGGWRMLWPDTREELSVAEMFSADQFCQLRNDA